MKKLLSSFVAAVLALVLFFPVSDSFSPVASVTADAATVSKPVASVESGTYSASVSQGMSVKLTCPDKGAAIYYSLNGGEYQ